MKEKYSVEDVCERFRVTARTLHYYEEIGLLTDVPRTEGGHRYYDNRIVQQLEQIIRLKDLLGISLQEIRTITDLETRLEMLRDAYHQKQAAEEKNAFLDEAAPLLKELIEQMTIRIGKLTALREGFENRLNRVNELRNPDANK